MFDILLILIIVLAIFIGYKKGFVNRAVKVASFIIAIILALLFQSSLTNFIGDNLGLKPVIENAVQDVIIEHVEKDDSKEENLKTAKKGTMLDKALKDISVEAEEKKMELIIAWSNNITKVILKGISILSIFILVSLVIGIIAIILNTVIKQLPVLKTLNGIGGALLSLILIILQIYIAFAIVSILSPLGMVKGIIEVINDTRIIKLLYDNNIIIGLIGGKII
ncbi:MAG: CvpA family protein [Clostridia bacterium]|nr:CvpA family protein [Clostridia bacterium]